VLVKGSPHAPASGCRCCRHRGKPGRGLRFGVWGLGFGVWGLGFGVWGLASPGFDVEPRALILRLLLPKWHKPQTSNLKPQTSNPKPQTPNPKPQTQNPQPQIKKTPNPKTDSQKSASSQTQTQNPNPSTPNPKPQTQTTNLNPCDLGVGVTVNRFSNGLKGEGADLGDV